MASNKYTPEQRTTAFWAKVDKSSGDDACWLWTASKENGYGRVSWDRKLQLAHRVSYQMAFGEIPSDLYVCHRCDNPSCVNPSHLFLGSARDNALDRKAKDRHANVKGEHHPRHKLTKVDVRRIFYLRDRYSLPYSYIGKIIEISRQEVGHIIRGENWLHP